MLVWEFPLYSLTRWVRWNSGARLLYVYIHTSIHTYIHTYIHNTSYIYTYVHTYIHTCMRAWVRACVRTYVHTYKHTYIHTCVRAYVHKCIYKSRQWGLAHKKIAADMWTPLLRTSYYNIFRVVFSCNALWYLLFSLWLFCKNVGMPQHLRPQKWYKYTLYYFLILPRKLFLQWSNYSSLFLCSKVNCKHTKIDALLLHKLMPLCFPFADFRRFIYWRSRFVKVTAKQITLFGRLHSPYKINVHSFINCISSRQRRYSGRGFKEGLCFYNCPLFHSKETSAPNFKNRARKLVGLDETKRSRQEH